MLITEILAHNACIYGDEIALIERDPAKNSRKEISWKEFDAEANRVANALSAKGIKKGDKVIQLLMNCIEWLPAYFGILRTGALAVPLNFRFSAEDIKLCSEIAEARAVIFGEEFIDKIEQTKTSLDKTVATYIFVGSENKRPGYTDQYTDNLISEPDKLPLVVLDLNDNAALYFTSVNTGTPKAVLLTHGNLAHAAYLEKCHHNQIHEDNFLCIPPLYHTGAKMHWFGNLFVGAKAVILKGAQPKTILESVSEEKITIVWLLVPWAYDMLVAIEKEEVNLNDYQLDQWRLMHMGAQPVPPGLIKSWKRIFPYHDYDTNYGLTESTGPGCVHLGLENTDKAGAIGVPGFEWECKVVNLEQHPVPRGESGELLIRGPGVMKEYYKNPGDTAAALKDGWLHTGDIARIDEEGFIWLVDRTKDIIITGGENIFPEEIEKILIEHPKIHDAACIGYPDKRLVEIVLAVIQVKEGDSLTVEDVIQFAKSKLPLYKVPRKVIFDQVFRSPAGKILKPELREKFTGRKEAFQRLDQEKFTIEKEFHYPSISTGYFIQHLEKADPDDRSDMLLDHLYQQVRKVLGIPPDIVVRADQGIADLGFDSIMAVNLRDRLMDSLDCLLPTTLAYDYPTIEAILNYLESCLTCFKTDTNEKQRETETETRKKNIGKIEELTEEELEKELIGELENAGY